MKNTTIRKTMQGLAMSLLATSASHAAILYQQDFSSYSGSITDPASVGWQYPWNDGFQITDQGTGTGMCLWHIGGFSHALTSTLSGSETQIVLKSLLWPQWGSATVGLASTGFNGFTSGSNAYNWDAWYGFGPKMKFEGGNFSIQRGGNEGAAVSTTVPVASVTAGNANFSLVIDVTTGLADGYFGSPETGSLLINDFDLKGTSNLASWQANILSMDNVYVFGNQAIHDNIEVSAISAIPEPSSVALLGGLGSLLLMRRRRL